MSVLAPWRVFIFILAAILLSPAAVFALEPKTHTFSMSPDLGYYNFKESGFKENGLLYGIDGDYTYRGKFITEKFPKAMLKVDGKLIFGKIDFKGVLFDGNSYSVKKDKNFISEFRGLAGYDFPIFTDTTITPYTGLGYRYLKDHLEKIDAGYRREANYLYTPIGFETNTPIKEGWSVGFNGEYEFFWHGWQNTYLSDLDPLFSDLKNAQTKGFGLKSSVKVRKIMEDKNLVFEPYVDYWNIGSSDTQKVYHSGVWGGKTFQEPKNTSLILGMRVGVEF